MSDARLKEGCWNCKFWDGSDNERNIQCYYTSHCRKNAPIFLGRLFTEYHNESTGWPKTRNRDWCGDWQQDWNFTDKITKEGKL